MSEPPTGLPSPSPPARRRFVPRFSLAAALFAMTLCAIGLWYWYRVPFEEEHQINKQRREVETVRRTWGGTVRHGERSVYLNDKLFFVENYLDGIPHGTWKWLDGSGRTTIAAEFRLGRLESFKASPTCDQRLTRLLAEGGIADRRITEALFRQSEAEFEDTRLSEVLDTLRDSLGVPISVHCLFYSPEFSLDTPITCHAKGPLIEIIGEVLQPYRLVCDYRYGLLCLADPVEAEHWKDSTGITEIVPPAGSSLEQVWNRPTTLEFFQAPLADALQTISDKHNIKFDISRIPDEFVQRPISNKSILVTVNLSELTLQNGLGTMLDFLHLQAHLDGETIVVELQPDHPLTKSPP